jgi:hypothetical protein
VRRFKLEFKSLWSDSCTKMLEDDEIFESMMKSKRRICSLAISSESFDNDQMNSLEADRLVKVVRYFSFSITNIELSGNVLSIEVLKLLNLIENVEKVSLLNIENCQIKAFDQQLNLNKLKEIFSSNCSENVLKIFNSLPAGVLHKIHLKFNNDMLPDVNQSIELFKNQHNLKEVWVNSRFVQLMNLKIMKLTSLRLHATKVSLEGVVNGQNEITSLIVNEGLLKNDLSLICIHLKSLKELDMSASETEISKFADISKLLNLKKLKISFPNSENSNFNESLSLITNESLVDLDIYSYHNELLEPTLTSIGLNCPRINKLKIQSRSTMNILNPIINYFPLLTELQLNGLMEKVEKPFAFEACQYHQNLKKMTLNGPISENQNFIKLLQSLLNLQELKTSLPVSGKFLEQILTTRPELKSLELAPEWNLINSKHKTTREFVEALKKHGSNLEVFRGHFHSLYCDEKAETLQEELRQLYTVADITDGFAIVEWYLRK